MATFPREEFSIHLVRQEQAPNCGSGFRRPLNPCSTSPALEVLWKGVGPESTLQCLAFLQLEEAGTLPKTILKPSILLP